MRPHRIAVGYHNWGMVHARFMTSMIGAIRYEGTKISDIIDMPSPYVTEARNRIMQAFLDHTKADYLLMLDADIEFPANAVSTMHWIAMVNQIPILGGNYSLGDFGNSIFGQASKSKLVRPLLKVEPNTLYRNAGGVATGFILVERGAMEQFRSPGGFEGPWHWFDHDRESTAEALNWENKKSPFLKCGFTKMGEDMSFCQRAISLGMEVVGSTHIPLIHHKFKATVPEDQILQFEGQRVYTKTNPWIDVQRRYLESQELASQENRPSPSGEGGKGPEGEQTNGPKAEGVSGGGVRDGDASPAGVYRGELSGGESGLEGSPSLEPYLPSDVHSDPPEPEADR